VKRYQVRIAPTALAHIEGQTRYIARDSAANAMQWNSRLLAAINQIGENPSHAVDESASKATKQEVRRTNFERTYLIYYVVNDDTQIVEILDVRHGARRSRFERQ